QRDSVGSNFSGFIKNDSLKTTVKKDREKRDYAEFAHNIISKALDLVPTDMMLKNVSFNINDNGKQATVLFRELKLAGKQLETSIDVKTNTFTQRWRITGFADPRNNKADIRFFNIDTGAIRVPYF